MASSAPPRELADGKLLIDEPAGGVIRLTISNPAKRNALDHPILDAISETLAQLAKPGSGARCVMLTGAHGMFSAGYDIGEIPDEEFEERAERLVAHPFTRSDRRARGLPLPTLAALPGHTIGGGLELALAAICASPRRASSWACPPRSWASSTPIPACAASSTRSARRARASCSCSGATSTPPPHSAGGSSTRSPPASELEASALEIAVELAGNAPLSQAGNKRVIARAAARRGRASQRMSKRS